MPLNFSPGWDREKSRYAANYGDYQAFLDSFKETDIRRMIFDARLKYSHQWVKDFIRIANDPFSRERITLEQGTHQVENLQNGGFTIHFTGRDHYGLAYHFYVKQYFNKNVPTDPANGKPYIFEISFSQNRAIRSVYAS